MLPGELLILPFFGDGIKAAELSLEKTQSTREIQDVNINSFHKIG